MTWVKKIESRGEEMEGIVFLVSPGQDCERLWTPINHDHAYKKDCGHPSIMIMHTMDTRQLPINKLTPANQARSLMQTS
jgi:hypothetical protein